MAASDDQTLETATSRLLESFSTPRPRRSFLKGAVTGAAGATALGAAALLMPNGKNPAFASSASSGSQDTIVQILSIAATAEQLAITFYAHGIANAKKLQITGANYDYLVAAIVEEQIHRNFLVANGGKPLTGTFSFPKGKKTFEDQLTFVNTLQQLEEAFIAAYLAAVSEFSQYGQHRLAQIAAQIMGVEAEHRGLGRSISPNFPYADNFAFEPALLKTVGEAVSYLNSAGYLSPKTGNTYSYHAVSTHNPHIIYRKP